MDVIVYVEELLGKAKFYSAKRDESHYENKRKDVKEAIIKQSVMF